MIWNLLKSKSKAMPVIGRGGLWGCEILRTQHSLENWLTDGSEAACFTYLPGSIPQSKPQALVQLDGLGKFIKFRYLIGSQTLPVCNIVTTLVNFTEKETLCYILYTSILIMIITFTRRYIIYSNKYLNMLQYKIMIYLLENIEIFLVENLKSNFL
jgi:hypothetical protein